VEKAWFVLRYNGAMTSFAARLRDRIAEHSPLCVGIDPSAGLLKSCGLPDTAEGCFEFGRRVLEAAEFRLAIIKPQSAFFERFGSTGVRAMEQLTALARDRGVLVLLDGKRGDIDTSGAAYAEGYFSATTPLRVDAITTHPYLGVGALDPIFDIAATASGGVFVVVRSSNAEGRELQTARRADGETVAQNLCREITIRNARFAGGELGPVGAVVGATCEDADESAGEAARSFILAPGVGAQGATIRDVGVRMPSARGRVLPSVSRAILAGGAGVTEMRATIRELQRQARDLL
jgi:orotidine-5'-phosphate decarboxylase